MIRLSKRLLCAAREIGQTDVFADIGTDHGQLVSYALERGIAERAFAVDISPKSLRKAEQNIRERGLSDRVEFFCGDGLKPLREIPAVVVIAGMGGNETVKILSESLPPKKVVSIPHQDAHLVRRYLVENGYGLTADYIVEDGKFYAVLAAEQGAPIVRYTPDEYILGKNFPPNEAYDKRNRKRLFEIETIIKMQNVLPEALQPELQQEYEVLKRWSKSHE